MESNRTGGEGLTAGAAGGLDRCRDGGHLVVVQRRVVGFVDHRAGRDPAQENRPSATLELDEARAAGSNGTGHGSKISLELSTC